MPVLERQLAGDQVGAAAVAVFQDCEQISPFAVGQGCEALVVEDEELGLGQAGEELARRAGP